MTRPFAAHEVGRNATGGGELCGGGEVNSAMRRNPLIIHLYDKPHLRRTTAWRHSAPSGGAGPAVLACAAIAVAVVVFFWAYDAVVHRENSFVPVAREIVGTPRKASAAAFLTPPSAPAPDLHSPAVALATADVPLAQAEPRPAESQRAEPQRAEPQQAAKDHARREKQKKAEAPPKKKRVHAAKRLPPEATRSYASEPSFFRTPYGGF